MTIYTLDGKRATLEELLENDFDDDGPDGDGPTRQAIKGLAPGSVFLLEIGNIIAEVRRIE